ncbi:MAG: hypothetical protein IT462_15555 [Planctomycetes bacterium]|nr:hypothetical protein [Planctomycetota bacterium]
MISLRLSPALKLMVALAAVVVVGVSAANAQLDKNIDAVRMKGPTITAAATDTWEPNNTPASVAVGNPIPAGYVPPGNILDSKYSTFNILGNIFRGQNGAASPFRACTNDPIWLDQGDEDWWDIYSVPSGTLHIALNQLNDPASPIAVEVYLYITGGSPTLVAGPLMPAPFYRELRKSNNPPDPYDGVVMDIPIAGGQDEYLVKVFEKTGPGTFPAGSKIRYELSYECDWGSSIAHPNGSGLDMFEGTQPNAPLNNFFLEAAADITPAASGVPQTFNMTYNGYDYYKVVLTSPASISVNLIFNGGNTGGLDASTTSPPPNVRFNYDLYWVAGGGNYGFVPNPMNQDQIEFEGAMDQWSPATGAWLRCQNPDTQNSPNPPVINTPSMAAGTYYFFVMCWDTRPTAGIGISSVFGSPNNAVCYWPMCGVDPIDYSLQVTTVADTDDQYDISPNNNDTAAAASELLNGTYNNLRMFWGPTTDEQDWFKVELNDGDTLEVRLDVAPAGGLCDDFTLELYSPPLIGSQAGSAQTMIDRSAADQRGDRRLPYKNASGDIGGWTLTETVGTWGTVGLTGNTRHISGFFYIRVMLGPEANVYDDVIATAGTYNLTIFVNGIASGVQPQFSPTPIVVSPEDDKESNDNYLEARNNPQASGLDGLTRNSKLLDFQDWYKVPAGKNDNIQATLIYTAEAGVAPNAGVDLDLLIYDMDQDIDVGVAPNIVKVPVCPIVGANIDIEAPGQRRVTVSATAGLGYNPGPMVNGMLTTAPNSGNMYIVVQRWGCRAAAYDLNINVNGRSPITALQITAVRTGPPGQIDAGLNQFVDIEVDISNVLSSAESITGMAFNLIHEKGADVTGQYAITGPLTGQAYPNGSTIPTLIPPGTPPDNTRTFWFRIQGNPLSTNGAVSIFPDASAGNKQVPGLASDEFVTVNGNPPGPKFMYTVLRAAPGSNLKPGGALVLEVVVSNADGTTAGILTEPAAITFLHSGLDISTEYTRSTNSPVVGGVANGMPVMLTVGQDITCEWFYGISSGATDGDVTVTFSGGGAANPETASGSFVISGGYGQGFIGGSSGCAQAVGFTAPWLLIGALFVVAAIAQRRRRALADKA